MSELLCRLLGHKWHYTWADKFGRWHYQCSRCFTRKIDPATPPPTSTQGSDNAD